ncbi:SDR family NAD(P)-dependent oxidoreductase [Streptomyces sp. V2]|uniref:SDR family NAD(P)-dependent oxidoreductase n=1 Tax=Streptomyces TaxID=1883 RepID=UPI0006EB9BD7|nr:MULTISPECIES: SDR family NAD(P)-dependent oxidoreductase [Streptomyces]PWG11381.1 SDR family NAD(P)-dependent oxidoreductase [Streptomyces sp. V2]
MQASTPGALSLSGRTALVTGASSGIGAATALALAAAGADVAVLARREERLEDTAQGIRDLGRRALVLPCDVTDPAAVETAITTLRSEFAALDVLVNNAGHPIFNAPFLDTRPEGWSRVLDLNLTAVARLCQLIGTDMVRRRRGTVINIASITAHRPWPAMSAYSAAKAGVVALSLALAQEWAEHGVRVNVVSPGWIDTDINRRLTADPQLRSGIEHDVPLGRWGLPSDVAGAILWLASDLADYVTGAHIKVDGGHGAQVPIRWKTYHLRPTADTRPADG